MTVKTIRVCSDLQGNRWGTIWFQGRWYVVDKLPPELLVKIAMDRLKKKTKPDGHGRNRERAHARKFCPHCGAPVAEEGCSNGLCEAVN